MSKGIANKIGKWLYADGARAELAFGGRHFTVVIAGARDEGIIGSEDNGIVIFDEIFGNVVLSNHVQETSGYDGPSARQIAEFKRILSMDWSAFTSFVKGHPLYRRGVLPDIDDAKPRNVEPMSDRIIFPDSAKDSANPCAMPLQSKREIVEFLCNHEVHRIGDNRSPWALAWDIKVRDFDESGRTEGYQPDPVFDEKWAEYVEGEHELFWIVAADLLKHYRDKEYSTFPGIDGGQYAFAVVGRNLGWLIADEIEGIPQLRWHSQPDMRNDLKGWSDDDLVKLYKLVASVDHDTSNPNAAMTRGFAAHRQMMEEQWTSEFGSSVKK